MPTYEYRCTKCGYDFEEFQSITAPPITFCPECDGLTERVITGGVGFIFKGHGFYQTDYRSDKYKSDARKDTTTATTSSSTSSSDKTKKKTDTKKKD
ncbi:MAG: zinc ribbon domain-containing protein [candidate division Zixibacteria bacterium]|nr:zinc ribbon domain-containing protein [candidate division Zixibacteria bacterium]